MRDENPTDKESVGTKDERIEQLEQELDALRGEFAAYREAVSKRFSGHEDELEALEGEVSGDKSGGKDGETGSQDGDSPETPEQTALDQIADEEQDDPAGVQITSSVDRAAAVMENWFDWSDKAPKGRVLRDGLKNLVETATGETLQWNQVYRAMKKVEQLTKGKIVAIQNKRHGWMLLQPS